jgi:mono/diheme cytochrome c family protein
MRGRTASASCVVCHGPNGKGDRAKLIPDLTGQPPGYLRNQLLLFKQELRAIAEEESRQERAARREEGGDLHGGDLSRATGPRQASAARHVGST